MAKRGVTPGRRAGRARARQEFVRLVTQAGLNGVHAAAKLVAQRAKEIASEKGIRKSGDLIRRINAGEPWADGWKFHCLVTNNLKYARAHEMGSGLHSEDASRRAKYPIWAGKLNPGVTQSLDPKWALSFQWPAGPKPHSAHTEEGQYASHYVFGKIMHPGVKPRPYMRPALAQSKDDVIQLVLSSIAAELKM